MSAFWKSELDIDSGILVSTVGFSMSPPGPVVMVGRTRSIDKPGTKVEVTGSCFARNSNCARPWRIGRFDEVAELHEGRGQTDEEQNQTEGRQDCGDQLDRMTPKIDGIHAPCAGQDSNAHDCDVKGPMHKRLLAVSAVRPESLTRFAAIDFNIDWFELASPHGIG